MWVAAGTLIVANATVKYTIHIPHVERVRPVEELEIHGASVPSARR